MIGEREPETEPREPGGSGVPARLARATRRLGRPGPWKRGLGLAALAILLGLVLLLHARIPNQVKNLGSLVETFLPWFGAFVPVLLVAALWRRSASAAVALLVPTVAWLSLFGGRMVDKSGPGGELTVASHNVGADNPDPAGTARELAASGADVLALEELSWQATDTYARALATTYPFHTLQGTVGVWSKLPLSGTRPLDIVDAGPLGDAVPAGQKLGANRALRTTVATTHGPLVVYVAHLGSVRVNPRAGLSSNRRDAGARTIGRVIAADPSRHVVLVGDLNGTTDDRALSPLTSRMRSAQEVAGHGFGFTWPAAFPVARIDQILVRGMTPERSWVLPPTGSDHRPVAAELRW